MVLRSGLQITEMFWLWLISPPSDTVNSPGNERDTQGPVCNLVMTVIVPEEGPTLAPS